MLHLNVLTGAVIFAVISTFVGVFVSELIFKDKTRKFEAKILLNFFTAGLIVHFIWVISGFSRVYCKNVYHTL
jgi:hypothetical protein